jgi:hypothetical protein
MLAKFLSSDAVTKAEFCRAEGLKERHFVNWQRIIKERDQQKKLQERRRRQELELQQNKRVSKRVRRQSSKQQPQHAVVSESSPAFIPLRVVDETKPTKERAIIPVAEIRIGEATLCIFAGTDSETLRALLAALVEYCT